MKKIVFLFLVLSLLTVPSIFAASVITIDKDELKSLLGTDNLVILDVRISRDWNSSNKKIKGAVRMDGFDLPLLEKYPKDTPLVLYCA
jgi:rhodanese-related sulfurtransferase